MRLKSEIEPASAGLTLHVARSFDEALGDGISGSGLLSRQEWDALLAEAASDVVFLTWQWQSHWWKHFGAQDGCQLHLLVLRDERGALAGIAPLFIAYDSLPPLKPYSRGEERPEGEGEPQRIVTFVGGKDVADYLDVIAPPRKLEQVWATVFRYLVNVSEEWDVIDFHSLPEFSDSKEIIRRLAGEHGLTVELFAEDVCPILDLPEEWEPYLMSLRKKDRHELRRKVRKLEGRDDARWRLVPSTSRDALVEGMQQFLQLHRQSDAAKARFMDDAMSAYFLDMAVQLCDTGWLDLAIMEVEGQPASAYLSFNYNSRLYLYNSGYDPRFASYSAGVALLAYRINKAILQGMRKFDFLRGDEPYKYDFGARDTYVYRAVVGKRDA